MKKLVLSVLVLILAVSLSAQSVGINSDGTTPDGSAILDLKSTSKGFLTPRMSSTDIQAINEPTEGLIVYDTDLHKPVYFNGTEWKTYTDETAYPPPDVGSYTEGGVVCYIFEEGDPGYVEGETHGLVCAVDEQSTSAQWGCKGTSTGANGTALGTGAQNTIDIYSNCSTAGIAAKLCADYTYEMNNITYDDWFLPAKNELSTLISNVAIVNDTLNSQGHTQLSTSGSYWSSSEMDENLAWKFDFSKKGGLMAPKDETIYVRAIRQF